MRHIKEWVEFDNEEDELEDELSFNTDERSTLEKIGFFEIDPNVFKKIFKNDIFVIISKLKSKFNMGDIKVGDIYYYINIRKKTNSLDDRIGALYANYFSDFDRSLEFFNYHIGLLNVNE